MGNKGKIILLSIGLFFFATIAHAGGILVCDDIPDAFYVSATLDGAFLADRVDVIRGYKLNNRYYDTDPGGGIRVIKVATMPDISDGTHVIEAWFYDYSLKEGTHSVPLAFTSEILEGPSVYILIGE